VAGPAKVGEVGPDDRPREIPDKLRRCGHCGSPMLDFGEPREWIAGRLSPGKSERFPVTYKCEDCWLPTVVVWTAEGNGDGEPQLLGSRQSPLPPPSALGISEYAGTDIEIYYLEASRCRIAGHRRAAIVMARSTMQACFRRYLAKADWGNYTAEMTKVEELAGVGWTAVGKGVRDFGNRWAHPEGSTAEPSQREFNRGVRATEGRAGVHCCHGAGTTSETEST